MAAFDTAWFLQTNHFDHTSELPLHFNAGNRCYGRDLALYLEKALSRAGAKTAVLDEDWGWLIQGALESIVFELGVGLHEGPSPPHAPTWRIVGFARRRQRCLRWFHRWHPVPMPAAVEQAVRQAIEALGIPLMAGEPD